MLLRHEDVSLNPSYYAKQMYQFIGHDADDDVIKWIQQATTSSHDQDNFSTTRISKMVVNKWRNEISYHGNEIVQEICNISLHFFGYKYFTSNEELRNVQDVYSFTDF